MKVATRINAGALASIAIAKAQASAKAQYHRVRGLGRGVHKAVKKVLVTGLTTGAGLAKAAATPIDVTAVTDQIAAAITPIGAIGAGVLLVVVTIATYKWVRRAL